MILRARKEVRVSRFRKLLPGAVLVNSCMCLTDPNQVENSKVVACVSCVLTTVLIEDILF